MYWCWSKKILATNEETQTISKESNHLITTLWYMSDQHAHMLHLHVWWPYIHLALVDVLLRSCEITYLAAELKRR